ADVLELPGAAALRHEEVVQAIQPFLLPGTARFICRIAHLDDGDLVSGEEQCGARLALPEDGHGLQARVAYPIHSPASCEMFAKSDPKLFIITPGIELQPREKLGLAAVRYFVQFPAFLPGEETLAREDVAQGA